MRVVVRSAAPALCTFVIPLASAAAHECFVVNRSDSGNARASGSGVWVTVTLHDLYETTAGVLEERLVGPGP